MKPTVREGDTLIYIGDDGVLLAHRHTKREREGEREGGRGGILERWVVYLLFDARAYICI